ncbi:hypothetical protein VUR80DRAFT_9081 [Thermomyces stellatus]
MDIGAAIPIATARRISGVLPTVSEASPRRESLGRVHRPSPHSASRNVGNAGPSPSKITAPVPSPAHIAQRSTRDVTRDRKSPAQRTVKADASDRATNRPALLPVAVRGQAFLLRLARRLATPAEAIVRGPAGRAAKSNADTTQAVPITCPARLAWLDDAAKTPAHGVRRAPHLP